MSGKLLHSPQSPQCATLLLSLWALDALLNVLKDIGFVDDDEAALAQTVSIE